MQALKEYWFVLANLAFFIGVVVFYFVGVDGLNGEKEKIASKFKSQNNTMRQLKVKKPTPVWAEELEKNKNLLANDLKTMITSIENSDDLIEGFVSTEDPSKVVDQLPSLQDRRIFKENLAKRWAGLQKMYCQNAEGGEIKDVKDGFVCNASVLQALEPSWLRNEENPQNNLEISEAQKRFWITEEVLRMLKSEKVRALTDLKIDAPISSVKYQNGGKSLWNHRDMTVSVILPTDQTLNLMKKIHNSKMLFRTIGFQQKNIVWAPEGVHSNVEYLHFTKGMEARVELTLNLRHFDYIRDSEESLVEVEDKSGRGRRGVRRIRRFKP